MTFRHLVLSTFLGLSLFIPFSMSLSHARSGGGHTSSSGSHSSGGSSNGGSYGGSSSSSGIGYGGGYGYQHYSTEGNTSGPNFLFLILVLIVIFILISRNRVNRNAGEDRASALLHRTHLEEREESYSSLPVFQADAIREIDPQFSIPAFTDFVYALYATLHKLRGDKQLNILAPYLSPEACSQYEALSPYIAAVKGIVISSLRIVSSSMTEDDLRIQVVFSANYTENSGSLPDVSYYSDESWILEKKKSIRSRLPEKMRVISCPNCGAAPAFSDEGVCSKCGQLIKRGEFTWSIESVTIGRHQTAPLLTETVEETGTDLPTIFDRNLIRAETEFSQEHPEFKLSQFTARANEIYFACQSAWTQRKPELVRPFESENIFQMHQYWINEYLKQGFVNVLREVKLQKVELVKVERDAFFESFTARMYGSMIDYTTQLKTGTVVTGSESQPREFTEYWTFIRSAHGLQNKKFETGCPSCGATLKINQTGRCEYCEALITSGDYDWVLSQIEQDESYQG
jgi:hypothetical protein